MDNSCRNFWWGNNQNTRKFTSKAWNSICIPKSLGGMGIKNFSIFNKALISKFAWSLLNNTDTHWKKFLASKSLKTSSFEEVNYKASDSWLWKGFLKSRDFVKKSMCIQINNGTTTRVWIDPWIPNMPTLTPLLNPNNSNIDHEIKVAELTLEEPRRWNNLFLQALFTQDSINAIQKLPLSTINYSSIEDKPKWINHSSGIF